MRNDPEGRRDEHFGLRRKEGVRQRYLRETPEDDEAPRDARPAGNQTLLYVLVPVLVGCAALVLIVVGVFTMALSLALSNPQAGQAPRQTYGAPPVPVPPQPVNPNPPDRNPPVGNPPDPIRPLPVEAATPVSKPGDRLARAEPMPNAGLPAQSAGFPSLLNSVCWTADGTGFYTLESASGTLRRHRLDTFAEERRLDAGARCFGLGLGRGVLILSVTGRNEVWLLDPELLDVKARIPVRDAAKVAAVPASRYAAVQEEIEGGRALHWIDLEKLAKYAEVPSRNVGIRDPVMSADGRYLYTTDRSCQEIYRSRLEDGRMKFEEKTPRFGSSGITHYGPCLSPDGKFVCLPMGTGNDPKMAGGGFATLVFTADDLRVSRFVVRQENHTAAVSFAPRTGRVYSHSSDHDLMAFDDTGRLIKKYNIAGRGTQVYQMLLHPDEAKILLVARVAASDPARAHRVIVVDLPPP